MNTIRLLSFAILSLLIPSLALASSWKIDPDHSSVQFKVQHMMISSVQGNFPDVQGTVVIDDKDITRSTVEVTIATASIDTRQAKRDAHLKSADFLDVEKYPAMTFKSKKVTNGATNSLKVLGDLTIHGVTREVELDVTGPSQSIKDPWGNIRKGAQATTRVNRKDFGLVWNKAIEAGGVVVGDDIEISLEVELIRQAG